MSNHSYVVLSTSLLLEEGNFRCKNLSLEEATKWVEENNPQNFCGHQTCKVVGLEPATSREQCLGYTEALCLSANGRLEFGKEYSVEEVLEAGVSFKLVTKFNMEEVVASSQGYC